MSGWCKSVELYLKETINIENGFWQSKVPKTARLKPAQTEKEFPQSTTFAEGPQCDNFLKTLSHPRTLRQ